MILYHGATMRVEHPLCDVGRADLDFGKGFYLTDLQEQAEEWAARQADSRKELGILNVYEFDKETAIKEFRYLIYNYFTAVKSILFWYPDRLTSSVFKYFCYCHRYTTLSIRVYIMIYIYVNNGKIIQENNGSVKWALTL